MPWKTHINNAPVESQKYMSKCQFTLHTTVENQKAIEWGRLKCCLHWNVVVCSCLSKRLKLLLFSQTVTLWICLYLELWASYLWLFPSFIICLACSVWLWKLKQASSVEQLQELLYIMNTIPQHIWQYTTLHKLVTSLYGVRSWGNHLKSVKRISTDDVWKQNIL